MTWLTPWAGLILAAAVIPPLIILYFLKLRRKPQAISSTFLWKKSVEDIRANAPFQKLRKSLLLFLQLLALALLALSVMQPQIQAGQNKGGKTVLLIDNSASMTSTNLGPDQKDPTRLDAAKRLAKEKIEQLYSGGLFASATGETMIIVFGDTAEVYCRFTSSKQQLLAAIDRIQPAHGETKIADALKLARAFTTNPNPDDTGRPIADPAALELYSDGQISDVTEQVLRGETLIYHAIGQTTADNIAIAGLSVERPYDRPDSVQVFAALLNFNSEPVTCDIQLSVDGQARGIEETTISAAEKNPSTDQFMAGRSNVVFSPFEQPRGAVIEVANLREDDLAADNVAQVVVEPPNPLTVAIVAENPDRSAVLKVLEGLPLERLEHLRPDRFEALAAQEGALDRFDVVVIDNYQPKLMPAMRYLTFGPTPPVEGMNEYGEGDAQLVLSGRDEHPVLRFVNTDNVLIVKFKLLQPADDMQVLLEGSRGPAAVTLSRGALHLIHIPFDPLESNWPLQRSFVTFIFNSVDFLGHAGEAITSEGLRPGEAITARLPVSATDISLLTPESERAILITPLDPAQFAWGPARLTGPYVLSWKTPEGSGGSGDELQTRAFAVNLLSETEGNLAAVEVMKVGEDRIDSRETSNAAYTPLWPYAIGVCLAVLMLEWWVYHRKAYI